MLSFRNLSLQRKQMLIIMLTSTVSLLLACAGFVAYDVSRFRRELVASLSSLAEVVGNSTTAALDFDDSASAAQALAALRGEPNIELAYLHTRDGREFASYVREGTQPLRRRPPSLEARHEFTATQLHLFRAIKQGDEPVGTIELIADLNDLRERLWRYAGIAGVVLTVSLLAAFGLSSRLQKLVSDPILRLARLARSVALEKNYSVRAANPGNDELGQLVAGFNEMLGQIQARDTALQTARDTLEKRVEERTRELEDIHKQLVEASRRGGMAEIATNVLHNVGNVLNSVNISTGLLVESVKKSRASSLARVVVLLREHAQDLGEFITNDPRGKHVPAHLAQLSEHLLAEQEVIGSELDSLQRNVEHIKGIVAMQQNYATFGGVKELINVADLVEDSLRLNESALGRHHVKVTREFATVPSLNLEKHKLLQILVNLVRNAKHACQDSERADKRLTVRVANGEGRIKISVIDNGVGIPPENLTRIFNYGFTTRKGGHGFGLHSGALAAKEMGGSLTAHSGGSGHGATFTLELPCPMRENSHE
jgi:two-component system, NtrC family, sensor kinase